MRFVRVIVHRALAKKLRADLAPAQANLEEDERTAANCARADAADARRRPAPAPIVATGAAWGFRVKLYLREAAFPFVET
jgi:hypothetical protein